LEGKIAIVMSGDWPHERPASPVHGGFSGCEVRKAQQDGSHPWGIRLPLRAFEPLRNSCGQSLHEGSRRRPRRNFSWIFSTRADRDLFLQDRQTRR
jgi:hypothetical protein